MSDAVKSSSSIAYRIYRTARLLRRNLLDLGTKNGFDLTPEQWFVLNKLSFGDGLSQVELGDDFFADRPNITRILSTMQKRGLVRRAPDPQDGRKQRVFLTDEGRRVHDGFTALIPEERDRIFAGMTDEDVAATERVLDQLDDNILRKPS